MSRQEKWLQGILFSNPETIPMDSILPGSSGFIPICRELTIPKSGGASVYLDIFGITHEAKLVLIECKLWRNPQARREVVAQALEYASLLRKWSYSDLAMRLQKITSVKHKNPLFKMYHDAGGMLSEQAVHDRVVRDLRIGNFMVIVAGDGIREDVSAIADHLNQGANMATCLALVEFQLFEGSSGTKIVVPHVAVRTEVLEHRVYLPHDDQLLIIEQQNHCGNQDPTVKRNDKRDSDRAFWQSVIDEIDFEHLGQPSPRHGGQNRITIPMSGAVSHLTAYREVGSSAGIYWWLKGEEGLAIYNEIVAAKDKLQEEIGCQLEFQDHKKKPFRVSVNVMYPDDQANEGAFKHWLIIHINSSVSTLRPFFAQFS